MAETDAQLAFVAGRQDVERCGIRDTLCKTKRLFGSQQDRVLVTAGIGRVAKNVT
jgi:hypothetical protein